ncbi:MAG: uroporphyrinogen-III C-methyltransferase [Planctomycetes bacterium]|nr:uroporphyrinogen-III C-methyltransferase [Planctomycetota bacterium]
MRSSTGIVFLVGAGPGDPGLITVKGKKCLEDADVVVFDALVNPTLLRYARPGAELVHAGKRGDRHAMEQGVINALLVERARAGQQVVRLKGGDPFLLGRGGEEAEALADAGVPFEVVPGIPSPISVAAYAGIPVTHRAFASTLTLVTGHECIRDAPSVDWAKVAASEGTLVVLMGMKNLPGIVSRLLEHGRSPDTPCAAVQWGTRPEQRTVVGSLGDIAAKVREAGLGPPGIIVAGEVVRLRPKLDWFERKPLFGLRVGVTRPREESAELMDGLEFFGAEALPLPVIEIRPVSDPGPLDEALRRLSRFQWVVFTSSNAVEAVLARLQAIGADVRALAGVRLCAIGPATARRLESFHLKVDLLPEAYRAEGLVAEFGKMGDLRGQRFLLPRADIAPGFLPEELRRLGAETVEVAAYHTVAASPPPEPMLQRLRRGEVHWVTFTSSSTAEHFVRLLGPEGIHSLPAPLRFASIGPSTSATARRLGMSVAIEAREHTVPGLLHALVDFVQRK